MMPSGTVRRTARLMTMFSRILATRSASSCAMGTLARPLACSSVCTSMCTAPASLEGGRGRASVDCAKPDTNDWKSALRATKSVSLFTCRHGNWGIPNFRYGLRYGGVESGRVLLLP